MRNIQGITSQWQGCVEFKHFDNPALSLTAKLPLSSKLKC